MKKEKQKKISEREVNQMVEDEEIYLNNFYKECFIKKIFPNGKSHMKTVDFFDMLCRDSFSYLFDVKQLKDLFMNCATLITSNILANSEVGSQLGTPTS